MEKYIKGLNQHTKGWRNIAEFVQDLLISTNVNCSQYKELLSQTHSIDCMDGEAIQADFVHHAFGGLIASIMQKLGKSSLKVR